MVREGDGEKLLILANLNSEPCRISLPAETENPLSHQAPRNLLGDQFPIEKNQNHWEISLPGLSGGYFLTAF